MALYDSVSKAWNNFKELKFPYSYLCDPVSQYLIRKMKNRNKGKANPEFYSSNKS